MACVTLKRPIDVLGSPHLAEIQPLAKRKRCGPPLFATTPSPNRGVKRAKRRLEADDAYTPNSSRPTSPVSSPFLGAIPPTEPGTVESGGEKRGRLLILVLRLVVSTRPAYLQWRIGLYRLYFTSGQCACIYIYVVVCSK